MYLVFSQFILDQPQINPIVQQALINYLIQTKDYKQQMGTIPLQRAVIKPGVTSYIMDQKQIRKVVQHINNLEKIIQSVVLDTNKNNQKLLEQVQLLRVENHKINYIVAYIDKLLGENLPLISIEQWNDNQTKIRVIQEQINSIKQKLGSKELSFQKASEQFADVVPSLENIQSVDTNLSQNYSRLKLEQMIQSLKWVDPVCFDDIRLRFDQGVIKNVNEKGFVNVFGRSLTKSRRFQFSVNVTKIQTGVKIGVVDANSNNPHNDMALSPNIAYYMSNGICWNGNKQLKGTKRIKQGTIVRVRVDTSFGFVQWLEGQEIICSARTCSNLGVFRNWVPFIGLQGINDAVRIISVENQ